MNRLRHRLRTVMSRYGLLLEREYGPDLAADVVDTIKSVRPYTMTTVARIEAVVSATEYLLAYDIPGAFVESGVWKGGSMMAAARTMVKHGRADRDLYMFDTYAGIPAPGEHDGLIGWDLSPADWWQAENSKKGDEAFLEAPIDQVRENVASTGYPMDRVNLIAGLVEDTVPEHAPDQIAFLRLDTDWYASTKVEMDVMFPRLVPGGVLIVDDYGFTEGARKAVDEFLADYPEPVFLQRIDSSGRITVKGNPRG